MGGASWAPLLELEDATWERDVRVNLTHHWRVGCAAPRAHDRSRWRRLDRGGGLRERDVLGGGTRRLRRREGWPARAGEDMAEEWWPHGIRVNAVVPGAVQHAAHRGGLGERRDPAARRRTCVERMALPEDVANAIAFLSS